MQGKMNIQLNEIEKRIQDLIEARLLKFLPQPVSRDWIAQRLADALKANSSTQKLNPPEITFPTEFILVVHPSNLELWQKEPDLLEGLTTVIHTVATEMGLTLKSAPSMTIASDPSLAIDDLIVRTSKLESVAETQNMTTSGEETPVRAGFLIIGGTNVFTLDQAVINLGRRLDNHLVIDDPRISRYHAQIRYVRNHFTIFDLNSTGGTFVNGQRITQSILYPGDVISLAGLPIVFGQDSPPSSIAKGDTAPFTPASSERATITFNRPQPKNDKNT